MLCNECLPPELKLMGVADHGVSEAIYLRDLDNNGLELYWITTNSMAENSRSKKTTMFTRALDLNSLLKEIAA